MILFPAPSAVLAAGSAATVSHPVLISNESPNGNLSENVAGYIAGVQRVAGEKIVRGDLDQIRPQRKINRNEILKNKSDVALKTVQKPVTSRKFWIYDFNQYNSRQINATLKYQGQHTNLWENGNELSAADLDKLGTIFDQTIYPLDTQTFGSPSNVDGDGKINILCYDISGGSGEALTAGYFDPNDLTAMPDSNHSELLYIDSGASMGDAGHKDLSNALTTMAHEFQHLINYNQKVLVQKHQEMDTWMNEGLAMAAEQIYSEKIHSGQVLQDRIDYYNDDPSASISSGQSLVYWDYAGDDLANYSLSYLFFQYLRIQCGQGNAIYKQVIDDPHSNYLAIQDVIQRYINPKITFGEFMTDFRIALYLNKRSGLYGFHGEAGFQSIKKRVYNVKSGFPKLRGGGAIVAANSASVNLATKGVDVTYTNLASTDQTVPARPLAGRVTDKSQAVSGTAEANATVIITSGGKILAEGRTGASGRFTLPVKKQKGNSLLDIFAEDAAGNVGTSDVVRVADITPPARPTVYHFSNRQLSVTGKAEPGSRVMITLGKKTLGSAKTSSKGYFTVRLAKKQRAGEHLTAYATDQSGNRSAACYFSVTR